MHRTVSMSLFCLALLSHPVRASVPRTSPPPPDRSPYIGEGKPVDDGRIELALTNPEVLKGMSSDGKSFRIGAKQVTLRVPKSYVDFQATPKQGGHASTTGIHCPMAYDIRYRTQARRSDGTVGWMEVEGIYALCGIGPEPPDQAWVIEACPEDVIFEPHESTP